MHLMQDPSLNVMENAMKHAGFEVEKDPSNLSVHYKPSAWMHDELPESDRKRTWDIEVDCLTSPPHVLVCVVNKTRELERKCTLSRSFYTNGMLRLHNSDAENWYTFDDDGLRFQMEPGDEVHVQMDFMYQDHKGNHNNVIFAKGHFVVPSKLSYVGSHGVLLLDPVNGRWSLFFDIMNVLPAGEATSQQWAVATSVYARLSGDGPL